MLRKILFTALPTVALTIAVVSSMSKPNPHGAISLRSIVSSDAVSGHADFSNAHASESPFHTVAAKGTGKGGKHGSGTGPGTGGGKGNGTGPGTGKAGRVMQQRSSAGNAWFGQSSQSTGQFGQYSDYGQSAKFNKFGTFNKFAQFGEYAKNSYTSGKYGQFSYKPW